MIRKIARLFGAGKAAVKARKDFKQAKAEGKVSIKKELATPAQPPGAAWLRFRAVLTGAVTVLVTAVINLTGLSVDDSTVSSLVDIAVVAGFVWASADGLRSSAFGLFSQRKPD